MGRNALYLAELGGSVICIDRDLSCLKKRQAKSNGSGGVELLEMDLIANPWPFGPRTVGGIVLVDFLDLSLFGSFEMSLIAGGLLLVETVSGRGGNYLELPKAGELKTTLKDGFEFEVFREKKVGPTTADAVTVRMLARRRAQDRRA